jgi:hypothetical protein
MFQGVREVCSSLERGKSKSFMKDILKEECNTFMTLFDVFTHGVRFSPRSKRSFIQAMKNEAGEYLISSLANYVGMYFF